MQSFFSPIVVSTLISDSSCQFLSVSQQVIILKGLFECVHSNANAQKPLLQLLIYVMFLKCLYLLFPGEIKPNCEFQRICSGKENNVNKAVVTCYDDSCTAIQNGQPIRMCNSCHSKQHKDLNDPTHIYQGTMFAKPIN